MTATAAERQRKRRANLRAAKLVKVEFWLSKRHAAAIKGEVARLVRKGEK